VTAVGFLHSIHAEGADGIGSLATAGHCCSPNWVVAATLGSSKL
jgi:hypothetical protein